MTRGSILAAARRDNSFILKFSGLLLVACLAIIGVHVKYLYNCVAGPAALDAALAAEPGIHNFVRAEGALTPTGTGEDTVLKWRGLEANRELTAEYMTLELAGRPQLVKVAAGFKGANVEGKLVAIPDGVSAGHAYPYLLDATVSYRHPNLLIIAALVLVIPIGLWFAASIRRVRHVERHPEIAALAKFGDPATVIERIEDAAQQAGDAAKIGKLTITSSWLIKVDLLELHSADDLIAVARETHTVKHKVKHRIVLWRRGSSTEQTWELPEAEATAAIERISTVMPWAVVPALSEFRALWKSDRTRQEAAADARRSTQAAS